ncbi:unnamed protein product, partial [Pylaiella littoralis]
MDALDPDTGKFPLEDLTLTTFDMNFPVAAVKLLVDKTNRYVSLFTTEPKDGEPDLRKNHQKAKKRTCGYTTLGD